MNKIRISALSILLAVGVSLPASAALFTGTGGTIPAQGTLDVPVSVTGLTGPQVLTLNLNSILHFSFPDLVISVISPSGVITALVSQHGGAANNNLGGNYIILDGAAATLQSQTASTVPAGSYKPLDAFSGFQSLTDVQLNGTWIVRFDDTVAVNSGSISSVGLDFTPVPEPATAGVMAAALLGVVAAVQGWRNRTRKFIS